MPLYEYICFACGNKEEIILSIRDAEEKLFSCSKCGAKLTKLMGSITRFEFKGNT